MENKGENTSLKDYVLSILLLALTLVIVARGAQILRAATGSELPLAVVEGRSMHPLLRDGDLVIVVKEKPQDIRVGDIIVYKTFDGRFIIHRVIGVEVYKGMYYYRTKGDNRITNPVEDCRFYDVVKGSTKDFGCGVGRIGVDYDRVVGVVLHVGKASFKIPYLGYISLMFRG